MTKMNYPAASGRGIFKSNKRPKGRGIKPKLRNKTGNMDTKIINRLSELLEYVHHVGSLNQKPVFRIDEYSHLNLWGT